MRASVVATSPTLERQPSPRSWQLQQAAPTVVRVVAVGSADRVPVRAHRGERHHCGDDHGVHRARRNAAVRRPRRDPCGRASPLNAAVFVAFHIDSDDPAATSRPTLAQAPLSPVVAAVVASADSRLANAEPGKKRTPGERSSTEGSNLTHLAVEVDLNSEKTRDFAVH